MPGIDVDSIVFTQDGETSSGIGKSKPIKTIMPPIDVDSISFGTDPSKGNAEIFQALKKPSVIDNVRSLFKGVTLPEGIKWSNLSGDEKLKAIERQSNQKRFILGEISRESKSEGIARSQNIYAISKLSGVPTEDISKHYNDVEFLASVSGIERGEPFASELIGTLGMAAVAPAAIAAPIPTAIGFLAFGALDTLLPTDKFIPEDTSPSSRETIMLIGMLIKGMAVGGSLHAAPKPSKSFPTLDQVVTSPKESALRISRNVTEILKKWTRKKLEEKGLPTSIDVSPEQLNAIQQLDNTTALVEPTAAELAANQKRLARREKVKSPRIDDLQNKILSNTKFDESLYPKEWVSQARENVLNSIDALYKEKKISHNKYQSLRYRLSNLILEEASSAPVTEITVSTTELLGIPKSTVNSANGNGFHVKVAVEKLVDVARESEAKADKVLEILSQPEVEGTGEVKPRGLSVGVEEKAVANKLKTGFGSLPEYQVVNMEHQALKATKLLKSDYDLAYRVAMGRDPSPKDVIPEAVFVAIENKAIKEGNVNILRDLAINSKLTQEATTMGQRIRTLAERDPESPMGAMKEILSAREERANRRLGKNSSIESAKEKVSKDIKKELSKNKYNNDAWVEFIKSIECK